MDRRRLSYDELAAERRSTNQHYGQRRHPIGVLLWNIRSAYNVGSIFRTCDAARVEVLLLSGYTPGPDRHRVHKTSLGAEHTVPWQRYDDPHQAIAAQRHAGHRIIAVELVSNARPYTTVSADDFPATFVFGNELVGIGEDVLADCDDAIVIPMFGLKHSLNVAVSVGIVLYKAIEALGLTASRELAERRD
ncbi:MAG: rRNA methyltransferase [Candidatus Kapaibacterium sp.]|nr:MAG: rRNA methyltransferase [Candidatus Kapabacteria bacterium]